MQIRGIRGVNGVRSVKRGRGIGPQQARMTDDDLMRFIEMAECQGCGEEMPAADLTYDGLCDECDLALAREWMYAEIERQKRAALREGE